MLSLVGLRPPAGSKIDTISQHTMIHDNFSLRGLDKGTIIAFKQLPVEFMEFLVEIVRICITLEKSSKSYIFAF